MIFCIVLRQFVLAVVTKSMINCHFVEQKDYNKFSVIMMNIANMRTRN